MIERPTQDQVKQARRRYLDGERPWPEAPSRWFVRHEDGGVIPLKYLYALATNQQPASYSTSQVKAAVEHLRLDVVRLSEAPLPQELPMITSSFLEAGSIYTRDELKQKFEIVDATVKNGIFRPKGHRSVWLFITRDKSSDRTPYQDSLDGDLLHMDGQTAGRTDHLIVEHQQRDEELLVFYRESKKQYPGAGFKYEGRFNYSAQEGKNPTRFTLTREISGKFKHGSKRTWELVVEAVESMGRVGSAEVVRWITDRYPSYNAKNASDLYMLSVNSPSRVSYGQNKAARRTDEGSEFDRLFKVGEGIGATFEIYVPAVHGVWEIFLDEPLRLSVRRVVDPVQSGLEEGESVASTQGEFDPTSIVDARDRVWGAIVRRRGQPAFRKALLAGYGRKCALTGCSVVEILEAAHVVPYKGVETNTSANGLLLRADIHTLFDMYLITIEPDTRRVLVSPSLAGTEYEGLQGMPIREASDVGQRVSDAALIWHRGQCVW